MNCEHINEDRLGEIDISFTQKFGKARFEAIIRIDSGNVEHLRSVNLKSQGKITLPGETLTLL